MINPDHEISKASQARKEGQSRMVNYNQAMSVQQLIDLVAFLQAQYKIKVDTTLYYPYP